MSRCTCVCGSMVQMTVLMDTVCVPVSLRPFLPLYLELITESPVSRDGGMCYRFEFFFTDFTFLKLKLSFVQLHRQPLK